MLFQDTKEKLKKEKLTQIIIDFSTASQFESLTIIITHHSSARASYLIPNYKFHKNIYKAKNTVL